MALLEGLSEDAENSRWKSTYNPLDEGLEILRIPLFCQEDSAILVITYKKELDCSR
jgi:hypothetical protein